MSNTFYIDCVPALCGTVATPSTRGPFAVSGVGALSRQTLATDPSGTTAVTFSGINAGTEIRVYLPDGTEVAGIELCAADQVLTWQVYAAGSPNNTVTVRLVHPAYKIKEFSFASSLGAVSLPVQQERDKWYSNPV